MSEHSEPSGGSKMYDYEWFSIYGDASLILRKVAEAIAGNSPIRVTPAPRKKGG